MEIEKNSWQEQFEQFRDQLLGFSLTDELPELAGPAVRQELLLRKKRLETHGLLEVSNLRHQETEPSQYDGSGHMGPGVESELRRDIYAQQLERCRKYYRRGRRAGSFRDLVELKAVTNGRPGSPETVFSEFIFHDTGTLCRGRKNRLCLWLLLPFALLAVIGFLVGQGWDGVVMLGILILPIFIVVFMTVLILFTSLNLVVNTRHQNKMRQKMVLGMKVLSRLLEIDPLLNTEYVVETALTLARRELYANNAYDTVMDVRYRELMTPLDLREEENGMELELKLYITSLVDDGRRLRQQPDLLRLTLWHEGSFTPEEAYTSAKLDRWSLRSMERKEKIK